MDDVFLLIEKNEIIGTVALKKDEIDDFFLVYEGDVIDEYVRFQIS